MRSFYNKYVLQQDKENHEHMFRNILTPNKLSVKHTGQALIKNSARNRAEFFIKADFTSFSLNVYSRSQLYRRRPSYHFYRTFRRFRLFPFRRRLQQSPSQEVQAELRENLPRIQIPCRARSLRRNRKHAFRVWSLLSQGPDQCPLRDGRDFL